MRLASHLESGKISTIEPCKPTVTGSNPVGRALDTRYGGGFRGCSTLCVARDSRLTVGSGLARAACGRAVDRDDASLVA